MSDLSLLNASLRRLRSNQASLEDLKNLREFIHRADEAIRRVEKFHDQWHWARRITDLLAAVERISRNLDTKKVYWKTVEEAGSVLACEGCLISSRGNGSGKFTLEAYSETEKWRVPESWKAPRSSAEYPLLEKVLHHKRGMQAQLHSASLAKLTRDVLERAGVQSVLVVPLFDREREVMGVIEMVNSSRARQYNSEEFALAQMFANQVSIAIQHAHLYQAARQRANELEIVHQASLSLTASLDLPEVLDAILEKTLEAVSGADDAHIFLYEDEQLHFGASLWADGRRGVMWAEPRPNGLTYTVARSGEAILVNDYRDHPLFEDAPPDWQGSIVGLPLKIGERVLGVMNVAHSQTYAFKETSLRVLRLLADQAAIAIENANLHRLVKKQARTDPLTSLFNRRALDERLEDEVQRSNRYHHPFSLLMMDLNGFKKINDTFGHPFGDVVLRDIAACLSQNVRNTDFLARYGGDEFAVIMPETMLDEAYLLAGRIQDALRQLKTTLPDGSSRGWEISIGIAVFPYHAQNKVHLLERADEALYSAKHNNGKGMVEVYSDK